LIPISDPPFHKYTGGPLHGRRIIALRYHPEAVEELIQAVLFEVHLRALEYETNLQ